MVQKAAYLKSGLTIKPSISKTLNGSVSYTRPNIYSLSKREATVDDDLDPCSGARKAHPGEKKQVDVPCGGKAKLHCKGGCIR